VTPQTAAAVAAVAKKEANLGGSIKKFAPSMIRSVSKHDLETV